MNEIQIETAQNISIHQNAAHLGDRMLAYIIDSIVIFVYTLLMILLLVYMNITFEDMWHLYLIVTLPAFFYYLLLEYFMNGSTVGKKIMSIRVVKLDGSTPNFSSYFIRWIMRIVDVLMSSGGVAVLTILLRGNGQRLGDIAAGTTVITEKKKVKLQDTMVANLPETYRPSYPQVTVFKDAEMQTIKELFSSAKRNGDHNVIVSLSKKIKEVTNITTQEKPIDFVATVIKDYIYYTQEL
ncbi:RDD domain-containing protein [Cellulophaga geojensis KL-A]|uniref:RDD domain-containing protein n=1 Tax=Cellulophaga geojensis KL-A TaxID=1328323 RepID=A0ABN0RQL6_9FLAO|nr:RDD family protein [Cellulophaga geojensis]EWH14197.1 RDD domain-containing protein [Cellulophaga geojensis KL-A]